MSHKPLLGRCPHCGKPALIEPSNAFRPFCSERCKLLDLGDWMNGRFAIPVEPSEGVDAFVPDDQLRQ